MIAAGTHGERTKADELRDWLPPALVVVALVACWQLLDRVEHVPGYLLPAPSAIASQGVRDAGLLGGAAKVTLIEMVLGFLLAVACALCLATVIYFSATVRRALLPLLVLTQTVPTVVFAPLLTIALGYALAPKVVIIAVVCFFPIVINTVDGLSTVDDTLVESACSLGAGRVATFRLVVFPAALPSVFSGARIAATYAAVGAVFAEWAGSSAGLGFVMLQAQPTLETARIFAAVILLCLMALGLYAAVTGLERLITHPKGRPTRAQSSSRGRRDPAARHDRSGSFRGDDEADAAARLDAESRPRRDLHGAR